MGQLKRSSAKHAGGDHATRPSRAPRPRRVLYYGVAFLVVALAASAFYVLGIPRAATAEVKVGAPAPDATFTTAAGARRQLSQFRGRPVMLWLFATWCPTCQAGTEAVARHLGQLEQAGLQIIQLRLYNNLGYPGSSVGDFAKAFASAAGSSPHWLWGDASQEASYTYDPRGYPDIYFLIDKEGVIRAINSAPNVGMDEILSFARSGR